MDSTTKPIFDFSDYIAEHTQNFTGREWVFAEIDQWLATPDAPRYFIITGEPGIGKTALAGRLTQIRRFDAIHFCIAREADKIDPLNFVRSISQQLTRIEGFVQSILKEKNVHIDVHISNVRDVQNVIGVQIENLLIEERNPTTTFEQVIANPLKAVCTNGHEQTIVILVDALDEAVRRHVGETTIVRLLEHTHGLPQQVRFLLTTRPDIEVLRRFEELKLPHLLLDAGRKENQRDVKNYLAQQISASTEIQEQLHSRHIDASVFVERAATASKGNFLYLVWLLRALAEGTQTFETLDAFPKGLDGIYRKFLQTRIVGENLDHWQNRYRPLLGVLATAKAPLTAAQLRNFIGLSMQDTNDLLIGICQFLNPIQAEHNQFQLYHQSLIDFIRDQERAGEFWIDLLPMHKRITNYYWKHFADCWRDCDLYGLRSLPEHLLEAKQYENLFLLAREQIFRQAQSQAFPEDPSLPLHTLQIALQGAADTDNAARMAEFLLTHTREVEKHIEQETPLEALRQGHLKWAWQLADLHDIERCILWYLLLAWELKDTGKLEDALATLERLSRKKLSRLSGYGGKRAAYLLSHIFEISEDAFIILQQKLLQGSEEHWALCEFLGVRRYFTTALELARRIEGSKTQKKALRAIRQMQAQTGKILIALETLGKILAVYLSKVLGAGEISISLRLSREIEISDEMLRIVRQVQAQVQSKEFTVDEVRIKELLTEIKTPKIKEDYEKAFDSIDRILDLCDLCDIGTQAKALVLVIVKIGKIESAFLGSVVGNIYYRYRDGIVQAALVQARKSRTVRTMLADRIKPTQEFDYDLVQRQKLESITTIARVQLEAGEKKAAAATLALALRNARMIANITTIARIQAEAGEEKAAAATLALALKNARMNGNPEEREEALRTIAETQMQVGKNKEAMETWAAVAKTISENWAYISEDRTEELQTIANMQAQAGECIAAIITTRHIDHTEIPIQVEVFRMIAQAQAKFGEINAVMDTIRRIDYEWSRAKAVSLQEGKKEFPVKEDFDNHKSLVQKLDNGWIGTKVEILKKITEKLMRAGETEEAKQILAAAIKSAQQITDTNDQGRAFQMIAKTLVRFSDFLVILKNAQQTVDPEFRMKILQAFAELQAQTGEIIPAVKAAQKISDVRTRAETLGAIAKNLVHVGENKAARIIFAAAVKSVQQIVDAKEQTEVLQAIAKMQAQAGELIAAIKTTLQVSNPKGRAETLRVIVEFLSQTESNQAVRKALSKAVVKTAQEAVKYTGKHKIEMLQAIAEVQIQMEKFSSATETVQQIADVPIHKIGFLSAEALQRIDNIRVHSPDKMC